ncbi:MAG: N-6 DNA methylase [Bacteroidales bacterium]|nr:N-6 DNA methylase [Bacteroidales bacterium]
MTSYSALLDYENNLIINDNKDESDIDNKSKSIHIGLVNNLIYTYLINKNVANAEECMHKFFVMDNSGFQVINCIYKDADIPYLCEQLHIEFLNSTFEKKNKHIVRTKSKSNLIETGSVYTKTDIATEIVDNTLNYYSQDKEITNDFSILDFACGTGRFYENIIKILKSKYGIENENAVLNNVFAVDIEPVAVNITRLKAINCLKEITVEKLEKISKNIILRNALIQNNGFYNEESYISNEDFGGIKFDTIVSNPPYLVLKINKNKGDKTLSEKIQKQVSFFRNSGQYIYSIEGMLNYYQLSIERMLTMLKPYGELGVICPSSLFADMSATKLRKYLILKNNLRSIKYFAEDEQLFENVTQATNIFYLQKGGITQKVEVEEKDKKFIINIGLIKQLFPDNMEIPIISETEWNILDKLSKTKKLKQIPFVRNRRGELDLTLFKNYITTNQTPYRLVRGNMIGDNNIKDINGEFVAEDFIKTKNQDFIRNDFNKKRLICQQISNAGLKRRLKFVFCNEKDILANSCNYLSSDPLILNKLYLILNSSLLNWRFKITSTNNHINNYELDELPIIDFDLIDADKKFASQNQLDSYVGSLYGLTENEINYLSEK